MAARKIILGQYGSGMLGAGEPVGELRNIRMWMAYLHHRWAIESGLALCRRDVSQLRGEGRARWPQPTEMVPAATQREVLKLLLDAIEPGELFLPGVAAGAADAGPDHES